MYWQENDQMIKYFLFDDTPNFDLLAGLSHRGGATSHSSLSSVASTNPMGVNGGPTPPPRWIKYFISLWKILYRPTFFPRDAPIYEKLVWSHQYDPASQKEIALNRRVGFYKFKSDLGAGNFSKVKLAHHQLTKGRKDWLKARLGQVSAPIKTCTVCPAFGRPKSWCEKCRARCASLRSKCR